MLNNQSFNLMKALEEAEKMEIKKKIVVDSYHEELIESQDLEEIDSKTYKDADEAEYYRNKELYKNSNLAKHKEAMEKAKKACKEKGIKLDEDNIEDNEVSKEERLASLKTQLEVDGDQLAPDEKAAIQEEINKLEAELNESCNKVEENVEINVDSETGDVEVTTDEGENVEVIDETEEPETSDEEVTDEEPSEELPVEVTDEVIVEESQDVVTEQEVSNLREVKNQGNIFMLQDDSKFIVGENYNESEALIENAEIYENKDEADKDYLGRCEITTNGKPAKLEESQK